MMVVKVKEKCAGCEYYTGGRPSKYDPSNGRASVDNSGKKCEMKKRTVLASSNKCSNFKEASWV